MNLSLANDTIGRMDLFSPLVMLGVGLIIGGLFIWLTTRTKLKYEYERARAEVDAEQATLAERLAGREQQVLELRDALEQRSAETDALRNQSAQTLANLSALQTRLEQERKANQEKLALLDDAQKKLADAFKALSADALVAMTNPSLNQ
jgi:DNA recombination protein RmuC